LCVGDSGHDAGEDLPAARGDVRWRNVEAALSSRCRTQFGTVRVGDVQLFFGIVERASGSDV